MIWLELLWTFLKIGAFTFGGGYAMLPLIQQEVLAHGWLQPDALVDFIAVSESTPGPFAVNIATYVGAEVGGLPGAVCATFGAVFPSFAVILLVAKCYEKFKSSAVVRGCMSGLRPGAVGLIGAAVLSIGVTVFFPGGIGASAFSGASFYLSLVIFAVCAVLAFRKTHPILILLLSAVLGLCSGLLPV